MTDPWFSAALVALAGLVGGLLPWTRRWSSEGMHRLVALSAGIFLGTVLHMGGDLFLAHDHGAHGHDHAATPRALGAHAGHDHGAHDAAAHEHGDHPALSLSADASDPTLWGALLAGFLGLAAVERLVLRRWIGHAHHAHHAHAEAPEGTVAERERVEARHAVLWRASLAGLSIHAFFGGVSLAGLYASEAWAGALLFMLLHKLVETFSLSTVLRLAGLRLAVAGLWIALFCAVTPVAFLIGRSFVEHFASWQPIAVAVAVGTFAWVTLVDLLPEAFHRGSWRDRLPYLLFGVALGGFVPGLTHGHGGAVWTAGSGVFVEMAPYLLVGFLAAGFVSQLLRPELLRRHLEAERPRSVAVASIVGAPLPLCSCSVVPVAASLRQAGASRGATSAFLVATPETGIDSVATTYALLGPVMAVVRPLAAVTSAVVTGLSVALFGAERRPSSAPAREPLTSPVPSCCHAEPEPEPEPEPPAPSCCHGPDHGPDHGHTHGGVEAPTPAPRRPSLVERAVRYAYVDLVDDLAWPLVVGVAASGLLGAFLPTEWLGSQAFSGPLAYLVMLAVGLPIYVCAAASTPIAAVLLAKGLSPGAVLVFLLASPATNLGTMLVVRRLLGTRGLVVHLVTLSAVTVLCGVLADLVLGALGVSVVASAAASGHEHGAGALALVAAALLLLVLLASAVRKLAAPFVASPARALA